MKFEVLSGVLGCPPPLGLYLRQICAPKVKPSQHNFQSVDPWSQMCEADSDKYVMVIDAEVRVAHRFNCLRAPDIRLLGFRKVLKDTSRYFSP